MAVFNALSDLRRLVRRPKLAEGSRRAQVIAITAQKGGVGKTTTAVHLAAGLARFHKKKTLLIDMDAQGHVAMSLGLKNKTDGETLSTILLGKRRDTYEVAEQTPFEHLWFVPSDRELNNTEALMSARIGKELVLRQALAVARTHFDFIVIDCPPNVGTLTVNALVAADHVIVPCDLSLLSLDGVTSLIEALATVQDTLNEDLRLLGLLKTRVDRRNQTVNRAIESTLDERYGAHVFTTDIGVSTAIAKAQLAGKPTYWHAPRSRGAKDYSELTNELLTRLRS